MKFKFIGTEPSDFMGFQWYPGTEHDVTDPHAVKKLSGSTLFAAVEGAPVTEAKPAKKQKAKADNGDDALSA